MAKKIKSFTVDEDVYNRLVKMFKKYEAATSISMYLNNKLTGLIQNLELLEREFKSENVSVPMSYVIEETVKRSETSPALLLTDKDGEHYLSPIGYWKSSYEAFKKGIPFEYYEWLEGNSSYALSMDKKFLIDTRTGKKYIADGPGRLMVVRDDDSENIVKK